MYLGLSLESWVNYLEYCSKYLKYNIVVIVQSLVTFFFLPVVVCTIFCNGLFGAICNCTCVYVCLGVMSVCMSLSGVLVSCHSGTYLFYSIDTLVSKFNLVYFIYWSHHTTLHLSTTY